MKYKAFLRLRVDKISVHKWTKSPFIGGQILRWVDKNSVGWTNNFLVYSSKLKAPPPLGALHYGGHNAPLAFYVLRLVSLVNNKRSAVCLCWGIFSLG